MAAGAGAPALARLEAKVLAVAEALRVSTEALAVIAAAGGPQGRYAETAIMRVHAAAKGGA